MTTPVPLPAFSMSQFVHRTQCLIGQSVAAAGSAASFNMNSATAELGLRIMVPFGCTIEAVAFHLTGLTGGTANQRWSCWLVNGYSAGGSVACAGPTASALASITGVTTNGITGWVQFQFSSAFYAGTGSVLWGRVQNTSVGAGPTSVYPTFRVHAGQNTLQGTGFFANGLPIHLFTTTGGWVAAGQAQGIPSAGFIVTHNGIRKFMGDPRFALSTVAFSGNTSERGIIINNGGVARQIDTIIWDAGFGATGCTIYIGDGPPGGAALFGTENPLSGVSAWQFAMRGGFYPLPQPIVIEPYQTYRVSFGDFSSSQRPRGMIIMMNGNTAGLSLGYLFESLAASGEMGWGTQQSGSTWINYTPLQTPVGYAVLPDVMLRGQMVPLPESGVC